VRVVALVLLATVAFASAGCGDARRSAVSAYIKQVNDIESSMSAPLAQVGRVNQAFTTKGNLSAFAPKLARAERTLNALQRRVAALHPPADARKLATLLNELVSDEAALAGQMHDLAIFLPAFRTALTTVGPASARFHRAAAKAKSASVEARALEQYAHGLSTSIANLRALQPPPVLRPTYATQLHTLTATQTTLRELALALERRDAVRSRALVAELGQESVSSSSLAAQRAQIAAVKAYNARVDKLDQLQGRLQREFTHVQSTV
jgi:hypothetical protein